MLTIYHNARLFLDSEYGSELRMALLKEQPITIVRSDLEAVATMDDSEFSDVQDALDRAYALTNHKKSDWWDNEGIVSLREVEERSTSMGDVIEVNGEFWIVAMTGFYQCTVV